MITHVSRTLIFGNRRLVVALFILLTVFMAYQASHLRIDAGFAKLLPLEHEYMKTYVEYRDAVRRRQPGRDRASRPRDGDIFTPEFFEVLQEVTDEVFFIPGVDRTRVMSLFTPNVRFTEVVEDGISGGNVIPDDFEPTPGGPRQGPREHPQVDLRRPAGGQRLLRRRSSSPSCWRSTPTPASGSTTSTSRTSSSRSAPSTRNDDVGVDFDYHIIGFAKVIGDIAAGAARVVLFFLVAFLITAIFVYVYSQSFKLTADRRRLLADRRDLAARAADPARLRHRPDVDPGAVPDLRDRGQPRRADGERLRRRGVSRAPTA